MYYNDGKTEVKFGDVICYVGDDKKDWGKDLESGLSVFQVIYVTNSRMEYSNGDHTFYDNMVGSKNFILLERGDETDYLNKEVMFTQFRSDLPLEDREEYLTNNEVEEGLTIGIVSEIGLWYVMIDRGGLKDPVCCFYQEVELL